MTITYSNTKPLETRQREAIAHTLSGILESNGYFTSLGMGTVIFDLARVKDVAVWPGVLVLNRGATGTLEGQNTQSTGFNAQYDIVVFKQPSASSSEDNNLWREQVKADIATAFGVNYGLAGADGLPTAHTVHTSGYAPWPAIAGQNFTAIAINLTVRYAHDVADGTLYT